MFPVSVNQSMFRPLNISINLKCLYQDAMCFNLISETVSEVPITFITVCWGLTKLFHTLTPKNQLSFWTWSEEFESILEGPLLTSWLSQVVQFILFFIPSIPFRFLDKNSYISKSFKVKHFPCWSIWNMQVPARIEGIAIQEPKRAGGSLPQTSIPDLKCLGSNSSSTLDVNFLLIWQVTTECSEFLAPRHSGSEPVHGKSSLSRQKRQFGHPSLCEGRKDSWLSVRCNTVLIRWMNCLGQYLRIITHCQKPVSGVSHYIVFQDSLSKITHLPCSFFFWLRVLGFGTNKPSR